MRCDQTPAWQTLKTLAEAQRRAPFDLRSAVADPARTAPQGRYSLDAPQVYADVSKNLTDNATTNALLALAQQCGVLDKRDAMLRGDAINHTEGRAVGHVWLRDVSQRFTPAAYQAEIAQTRAAMLDFAEKVRANPAITDVVNIGIGGSDLGPRMVCEALQFEGSANASHAPRLHFVSNVDAHELYAVLRQCQPRHTLFLIASKTFTTQETMANAHSARAWFLAHGGNDAEQHIAAHFAALTTNVPAAQAFGIAPEHCFGFWDWVGGRYSVWSSIGLPVAILLGGTGFLAFLQGAAEMDAHFASAAPERNLPLRLALLDVWNGNFLGAASRCVAPYDARLRYFAAYLQQLEMESNGKRVDAAGQPLPYATSGVVWGEPGTNGQHAFFQCLHQGTALTPVEFVAVKTPHPQLAQGLPSSADHQRKLLANAVAQAQALLQGKTVADGHRHFVGNKPSTFLVLDALTPQSLGALIALYEHRVFCAGAVWGINSFDQFGVELGKVLAAELLNGGAGAGSNVAAHLAAGGQAAQAALDRSTQALVQKLGI